MRLLTSCIVLCLDVEMIHIAMTCQKRKENLEYKYSRPGANLGDFRAAFDCLWNTVWRLTDEQIAAHEKARRITVSAIWFTITLVLAIFIPNIGVVIQILGAFAAIFIFIFPGKQTRMMSCRKEQKKKKKMQLWGQHAPLMQCDKETCISLQKRTCHC